MLTFATPELLFLILPAVLFFLLLTRRKKKGFRFSDNSLIEGLPRGRAAIISNLQKMLHLTAIFCLILTAAGLRTPDLQTRIPAEGIAVIFALDVSGSMADEDFIWTPDSPPISRLTAAKRTFALFSTGGDSSDQIHFEGRPNDSIGLITFAAWPEPACPLTLNHSVLVKVLESQSPKVGPDAGTNIGDAIAESLIRLESASNRRKVLILLSDGEHNISLDRPDSPLKPRQAAQLAADLRIPIYTIDCGGVGTDADAVIRREEGKRTMQSVAEMTGGKPFVANNGLELRNACQEIDRLERESTDSFSYRRYRDFSPWLLGIAISAIVLAVLVDSVFWRTIPK